MSERRIVLAAIILLLFAGLAAGVGVVTFRMGQQATTADQSSPAELTRVAAASPLSSPTAPPPPPIVTNTPTVTPLPTPTFSPPDTPTPSPSPTFTPSPTPTPTPTPIVVISQIRPLGRLETSEYVMQTVIDLKNEPSNLWERVFGTDKLILIAAGEVVGGFDLTKVREEDIKVDGTSVTITLPPPEILYSRIDNDRTYVYERETGLLRRPDVTLESRARQLAEQSLVQTAEERGIYDKTEQAGRLYLEGFLRSLGFTEVKIEVRPKEL